MEDPETPKAYVELAAVLNPACGVEKVTDLNHRVCAPPPPAPPPTPPPPNPPPRPPASSTLAFATTVAQETWGAFYRSFSPYEWDAPTDEDYCKWMADVLVCDYIKNADDCEWKDSDAGGSREVLTPCEWYEGKCELRDYLQIGARELRNAFRNVLAASQSAHDAAPPAATATTGTKTIEKNAWRPRTGASPSTPRWPPRTPRPPRYEPPRFSAWCTASTCTASCGATRAKARKRSLTTPTNTPNATDARGTRLGRRGGPVRAHPGVARGDVARGLHSANAARAASRAAAAARRRVRVQPHEGRRLREGLSALASVDVHGRLQRHLAVVDVRMHPVYKRHPECPKPDSSESEADSDENGDDSSDGEVTHSEITVETSELVKSDDKPVLRGAAAGEGAARWRARW